MSKAVALAQAPARLHQEPDYDVEICTREVVEILACASRAAASLALDRNEVAEKMIRYIGEVYKRDPATANAAVVAYTELGGSILELARVSRKLRNDPSIGGFLAYLKANLLGSDNAEGKRRAHLLVRRATERAFTWSGKTTEETRAELNQIDKNYGVKTT